MFTIDRTVKLLLAVIAILLAVLVFRPQTQLTPIAWAQDTSTTTGGDTSASQDTGGLIGYRTSMISSIAIAKTDKIRSLQVVNSAQSFVVQYDNRLEVYRIGGLSKDTLGQLAQKQQ